MEIAYKNILTVNIEKDGTFKVIDGRIRQYDYGKILRIQGIRLPAGVKIEFSTQASGGETVTRIGLSKNGVTEVTFPDEIIENGYNSSNYIVYVFVYLTNEGGGETVYKMNFFVESRPKPQAFDRPEDGQLFAEAIEVFNRTAAAVKESEKAAEGWAHGREDMPERTEDNAKYYSNQAKKDALQTGKDKQDVEELIKQTSDIGQQVEEVKENAQKAIESERNAKLSEKQAKLSEQNAGKSANLAKDAADEIAADRDQIRINASELNKKAEMIVNTAFGESMILTDSSEKSLIGLSLYGKSTQVKSNGLNLIDVKSVFSNEEKNGITFSVEKDEIIINGTANGNVDLFSEKDFLLKFPAGEYTFSISQNANVVLYLNMNSKIYQTNSNGVMTVSIAPDSAISYFIVRISNNAKFNNYRLKIMINTGSVAKTWEPYTGGKPSPSIEYPKEIVNVAGDKGNIDINVLGTNLAFSNEMSTGKDAIAYLYGLQKFYIKAKRLSGTSQVNCRFFYVNGIFGDDISILSKGESKNEFIKVVNAKHPVKYIALYAVGVTEDNPNTKLEYLMISPVDVPYEPYKQPQTLTIPTQNGLPGIPVNKDGNYIDETGQQWICDEIDLERGKYVQRVAEQVYNTVSLIKIGTGKFQNTKKGIHKLKGATSESMSNFARYNEWANAKGSFAAYGECFYYHSENEEISVDEINELFNSKLPIKILGQLESPIEHDLPPEVIEQYEKIHTNYPVTTVLNDAGVWGEISYVADTKLYIDQKNTLLKEQLLEIQRNLIHQKISGGGYSEM